MSVPDVDISECLEKLKDLCGRSYNLKPEQSRAVKYLLNGGDVLAVLPTGFGKSFVFQLLVMVKDKIISSEEKSSVLVICPLESIVEDQMDEARSLGLTCCSLKEADMEDIRMNKFQLLFSSAERVLQSDFKHVLKDRTSKFHQNLIAVVVDESHTVQTWTAKRDGSGTGFREAYGDLSVLRSLCKEGTPVLALTGTADKTTAKAIISGLAMKGDTLEVFVSPNRENLRISVIKTKKEDGLMKLDWLIKLMKEERCNTPKTIIFCNTLKDVGEVSNYLLFKLGADAYEPSDSKKMEDCMIGIYHSMTFKEYKERVVKSLKGETGTKRVVIATSALSMGVNFPDIRYIIHWGPARNLLDHHQESGRAGRDNLSSDIVVLFHGNQLTHCDQAMKNFVRSTECLRIASYEPLDPNIRQIYPGHMCCSNCSATCVCGGSSCSEPPLPFLKELGSDVPGGTLSRPVSESDRQDLRESLLELKEQAAGSSSLFDSTTTHGFSLELVKDITKNSPLIFTLNDVMKFSPVFSTSHALKILEIFDEIFADIQGLDDLLEFLEREQLLLHEEENVPVSFHGYFDDRDSGSSDDELVTDVLL